MTDQLAQHFADVLDQKESRRAVEAEQRARSRELNAHADEQEHRELVTLADELEHAMGELEDFFRRAGFRLPLIENIKRASETSVTLICLGEQYSLTGAESGYSTPTRLYYQVRRPHPNDVTEWSWQTVKYSGLPPGKDDPLIQEVVDYFFEKATEKLCPAARERLDAFLRSSKSAPLPAQP
ncbi:MAG TPA: hypothetical protein VL625_06360 [Patescibacteria group bacterium]|nr:hypothetical protein [Patescibacteria group bacterium]